MDVASGENPATVFKCKQVNFVDTNTLGQEEFLFVPYSVFTVLEVHVPANPSDDDIVTVPLTESALLAAVDNVKEEEGLDLAPWYRVLRDEQ